MNWIKRLFGRGGTPAAPTLTHFGPPAPEETFYAIGDVHGCADPLRRLVDGIMTQEPGTRIVCVGDYVDRGEHSAEVLAYLQSLAPGPDAQVICLIGNHEEMCLKFLDDPEGRSERWLRYGGLQTLASYGIGLGSGRDPVALRDALAEAMGPATIDWLRALPTRWRTGNVAVVHAGADPWRPIEDQPPKTLMWGHQDFETTPRPDGIWVVHGHTIVDAPLAHDGRIAVDTGAYATGQLTAARISAEGVSFVTA